MGNDNVSSPNARMGSLGNDDVKVENATRGMGIVTSQ